MVAQSGEVSESTRGELRKGSYCRVWCYFSKLFCLPFRSAIVRHEKNVIDVSPWLSIKRTGIVDTKPTHLNISQKIELLH